MKIAVAFDTPCRGWTYDDHWDQFEAAIAAWDEKHEPEQEHQVAEALRRRGHTVRLLAMEDAPGHLLSELAHHPVDLVFNCIETFNNIDRLDYLVPALLEAEGQCYTGAPPFGLMITRNKALSKTILAHRGIRVPAFTTYEIDEKVPAKPDLSFPAIVKPLQMDASVGISQASVVWDRNQLAERVKFVHELVSGPVIAEQFVEGRELYATVIGNGRKLRVLPATELIFDKDRTRPEQRIATQSAKWDEQYRARNGIKNVLARPLSKVAQQQIEHAAFTAFQALSLRDYARVDLRLDAEDRVWVLEINANPYLNRDHEVALAAAKAGLDWTELVEMVAREARSRYQSQERNRPESKKLSSARS
jgi:D-alanine-D-alanine ligase